MLATATVQAQEKGALPLSVCIILVRMALAEKPRQPKRDDAGKRRAMSNAAKVAAR